MTVSPGFGSRRREVDAHGGGRAGWPGRRRAGHVARDRTQLEAERRHLFVDLYGVRTTRTDRQPAAPIGAQIRLVALVDELLQSGPRSVAVQDVVERLDGRRVGGTARKQVAIAGPRIEQRKQLVEGIQPGLLGHFGAAAVADAVRLHHRRLHPARNINHVAERGVHKVDARHHVLNRIVVRRYRRKLRIQADGDAAIDAKAGISGGLVSGGELALQVVKLRPHLHQLLHDERGLGSDRGNTHSALTSASARLTCPLPPRPRAHWRHTNSATSAGLPSPRRH